MKAQGKQHISHKEVVIMSCHFFTIEATFNLDGETVVANIQVETENLELDKVANNVLLYEENISQSTNEERTYEGIVYHQFNDVLIDNLDKFKLLWVDEDFLHEHNIDLHKVDLLDNLVGVSVV